jgi:hypothetical protein
MITNINPEGTVSDRVLEILTYAVDVVMISRSFQELKTGYLARK